MTENWKPIPGYEGIYEASTLGRLKSICRNKILDTHMYKGYPKIVLSKNKIRKTYRVHQLIAMTFLNHKPNGMKMTVNHKDFNRTNNRVDNLEIVSHRTNANQAHRPSVSKYTGVHKNSGKKWRARIHINGENKHLGYFNTEQEASAAYQKALKQVH